MQISRHLILGTKKRLIEIHLFSELSWSMIIDHVHHHLGDKDTTKRGGWDGRENRTRCPWLFLTPLLLIGNFNMTQLKPMLWWMITTANHFMEKAYATSDPQIQVGFLCLCCNYIIYSIIIISCCFIQHWWLKHSKCDWGFMFVLHEKHRNYHSYPEILSSTVKSYKKDVDIIFE